MRDFAPLGVRGALYRPGSPLPVVTDAVDVAFGDPLVRWVRAGQLIMQLRSYVIVDMEAEARARRC